MKPTRAIFPVAGLGTRFLPATKANPKEMLPIVDKPLIQYAVEEAVAAGITELIFITSSSKRAIEDHFDVNMELEMILSQRGCHELLQMVRNILPSSVSCSYIRQKSPQGLGHAVLCAKPLVMNEPVAVLLADDLIYSKSQSCLQQMMDVFAHTQASVVAVEPVPPHKVNHYGIVDVAERHSSLSLVNAIIEKPELHHAPSNLAVVGRYILTPGIFTLLEQMMPLPQHGEMQLTDAIAQLLAFESVYAYQFQGTRYDCGSKLGYLAATLEYALQHSELHTECKHLVKKIAAQL